MSIYDNETKIYPDLEPTAPPEQSYRLRKLSEIETYFLDETDATEQIAKKMKRFNMIAGIIDAGLIKSTVITGGISITAFASVVGFALGGNTFSHLEFMSYIKLRFRSNLCPT